jgi:hypothetical protein
MKLSYILFAAALLLGACQKESNDSIQDIHDTVATTPAATPADTASHESADMLIGLADFPNEWVRLTKRDGIYTIFKPCDADNASIHIVKADGRDVLQYVWGQEVSMYPITEFQRDTSGITTITVRTETEPYTPFTYNVQVVDPMQRIMLWKWEMNTNGEKQKYEEYFTLADNAPSFTTVTQPCTDCWPEEECKKMEKNRH